MPTCCISQTSKYEFSFGIASGISYLSFKANSVGDITFGEGGYYFDNSSPSIMVSFVVDVQYELSKEVLIRGGIGMESWGYRYKIYDYDNLDRIKAKYRRFDFTPFVGTKLYIFENIGQRANKKKRRSQKKVDYSKKAFLEISYVPNIALHTSYKYHNLDNKDSLEKDIPTILHYALVAIGYDFDRFTIKYRSKWSLNVYMPDEYESNRVLMHSLCVNLPLN